MASNSSSSSSRLSDVMEVEDEVQPTRGRGRGRPRGRGRGSASITSEPHSRTRGATRSRSRTRGSRSRGRARSVPLRVSSDDQERVKQLWEDRKSQMKEVIQTMALERMREVMLQMVDREPGLVFDLCEDRPGNCQPTPPRPSHSPEWCSCGNCRDMPTDLERKCCGCRPDRCIATRNEMDRLCLDQQVLAIGQRYYRDMLGRYGQRVENANAMMRHSAYRNFILWRHGRLGAGIRRVIPSCCVWRIRDRFPSETGMYTGFVPARFV